MGRRRTFSIYGDSISTFHGWNPEGYSVFYDEREATRHGLSSARDTWWLRVIETFDGELCVNNAYSGSRVTGLTFPAGSSEERIGQLAAKRPDVLLCYLGFNDFGYEVPVGRRHGLFSKPDIRRFADAYPEMLARLKRALPETVIVCGTLMETFIRNRTEWAFPYDFGQGDPLSAFNGVIRDACRRCRVRLADLNGLGIVYETLDGAHATLKGHGMIAEGWCRELQKLL